MRDWLLQKLASKISNGIILLDWFAEQDGSCTFQTVHIDNMLNALYAKINLTTGEVEDLNIPQIGSYENLLNGDLDGKKGYKYFFEKWHQEGLI